MPTRQLAVKVKDPQWVLDYVYDFGGQMAMDSDTVNAAPTPTVGPSVPAGLTINTISVVAGLDDDGVTSVPSSAVKCWLSGGTAGVTYAVTCHVTTGGGRTWEKTGYIRCEQR